MKKSLRTRLTVIFVGLTTVPLLLVGLILTQRSFAVERQQAMDLQRQVAQGASSTIAVFFHDVENALQLRGSQLMGLEAPDRAQRISLLLGAFNPNSQRNVYQEFALLDGQGREQLRLSVSETVMPGQYSDLSNSDTYQQPLVTGDTYFSPLWFDPNTHDPLVTIAVPLYELRSIRLQGVLVADMRFRTVSDLLSQMEVGPGQSVYVLDSGGRVVAHPTAAIGPEDLRLEVMPDEAVVRPGLDGKLAVLAVDSIQLGEQTFYVVAERPASDALRFATATTQTLAVTLVGTLLVAAAVGIVVVRQIVRPVEELARTAQSISEWDLTQTAEVTSQDEIGRLAETFNAMTARLRELIGSLEKNISELQIAQTENRKLIEQLREASRSKDEFVENVNHELRTPITGLKLFLDLLERAGPERRPDIIATLHRETERLYRIIEDVLRLSNLDRRRVELNLEPVDLSTLAQEYVHDRSPLAEQVGLELAFEGGQPTPAIVGDRALLGQALSVLLTNAINYTPEGGKVTVSTLSRGTDGARWAGFQVSDTGPGVPPEDAARLFERFFRGKVGRESRVPGTGLGLSIVSEIVGRHEGRAEVESTGVPGQGATFTVWLPVDTKLDERSENGPQEPGKDEGRRKANMINS